MNPLKGKLNRTFGETSGRRSRSNEVQLASASVIYTFLVQQGITDTACPTPHDNYVIVAGQHYGDSFSSKEKPNGFSNMPKLFPQSGD